MWKKKINDEETEWKKREENEKKKKKQQQHRCEATESIERLLHERTKRYAVRKLHCCWIWLCIAAAYTCVMCMYLSSCLCGFDVLFRLFLSFAARRKKKRFSCIPFYKCAMNFLLPFLFLSLVLSLMVFLLLFFLVFSFSLLNILCFSAYFSDHSFMRRRINGWNTIVRLNQFGTIISVI